MATFEIIIQRKSEDGWPVIALETRMEEFLPVRSEGMLLLNLDALRECGLAEEYGTLLGKALFRDGVGMGFTRALTQARSNGEPLRVLLTIEDAGLKTIHWERLSAPFDGAPAGWDFLALHQETPFSLYLPSLTGRSYPAIGRRDLRALVIVAGPEDLSSDYGLEPFDVAEAVQAVKESLGSVPCDVLASVEGADGKPDLNTLCERITGGRYTLLHITCHAKYSADGETRLYLPGEGGRPVTASTFIERLGRLRPSVSLPHFTFLMACESASPEAENGLGGLGQRMVRELGMPAVLAMTGAVSRSTADALAKVLYARLFEHGEPDRALAEGLSGLMGRYDIRVPAIFSRLGGRSLFSDTLSRPLTAEEIDHGLERMSAMAPERAPVMVETITRLAEQLRGLPGESGLSQPAKQERGTVLQAVSDLCEQIFDLSFPALALDKPVPVYDRRCPFPGLAAFHVEDRDFFFGRESLVRVLAQRLQGHPFLAVLGASGSGKSSAVLAGLVPALGGSSLYLTPGADPSTRLKNLLEKETGSLTLLVVDQFEEVFTLCRDEAERRAFFDTLLVQVKARQVVITMRADFFGECAPYPALRAEIQSHTELVAPMDGSEMRRAIEQQAAAVGLRFEADLVDDILEDVGFTGSRSPEPGAMPLLQHALLLLWQRRRGRWLLLSEYRAFGTVREAIAHTAGEIYGRLSTADQQQMRAIFLRLTRVDTEESGSSGSVEHRDTRRRAELDELVPAGADRADTLRLISRLADARLVVTGPNPVSGKEEVEVAHEALIRHWPLLRRWLDEDRDALRAWENIREAAQDWAAEQRDDNLLVHRGGRLEDALALAQAEKYPLSQLEQEYLRACQVQVQKERQSTERRRRATVVAALAVAVVMAALAIWGIGSAGDSRAKATDVARQAQTAEYERGRAENNAATATAALGVADEQAKAARTAQVAAEQQADISLSRQLAVQARDLLNNRPDKLNTAALLAIEAYRRNPEPFTSQVLSDALNPLPKWLGTLHCDGSFFGAKISPNGRWIATGCYQTTGGGLLQVWDTRSGKERWRAKWDSTPNGYDNPIVFTPDGQHLVTGGGYGNMQVWDASTGEMLRTVALGGGVDVIAISPDSQKAIGGSHSGDVLVWDIATGRIIFRKKYENNAAVYLARFSPDNRWVIACNSYNRIDIWEPETDQEIASVVYRFASGMDSYFRDIGFSENSVRVLITDGENLIVWDVTGNRQVFNRTLGADSAAFSADGNLIITGTKFDSKVSILDSQDGSVRSTFNHSYLSQDDSGYADPKIGGNGVEAVFLNQDGTLALSQGQDLTLRLWSRVWDQEIGHATLAYGSITTASPDLRTVATLPNSDTLKLYEMSSGKEMARGQATGSYLDRLSVSPDGRYAAAVSDQETATVWEVASGRKLGVLKHDGIIQNIVFSPDGTLVASADFLGTIKVWDPITGEVKATMDAGGEITSIAFSADGKRILSGTTNGYFAVLDPAIGKEIGHKQYNGYFAFAISPDGWKIAQQGLNSFKLVIYDFQTGLESTNDSYDNYSTIAFSPDGSSLVTGNGYGLIEIWDVRSGKKRFEHDNTSAIMQIHFSSDGRFVAAGGATNEGQGQITFLDLKTGEVIGQMKLTFFANTFALSPDGKYVVDESGRITPAVGGSMISKAPLLPIHAADPLFTPDGKSILTIGPDYELQVLDWRPEDMPDLACARLEQSLTEEEWKTYVGEQIPYRATCPGK